MLLKMASMPYVVSRPSHTFWQNLKKILPLPIVDTETWIASKPFIVTKMYFTWKDAPDNCASFHVKYILVPMDGSGVIDVSVKILPLPIVDTETWIASKPFIVTEMYFTWKDAPDNCASFHVKYILVPMDGSGVIDVSVDVDDVDVNVDVHEDGVNTVWCKYNFIHILTKLDLRWRRSQYRML